MVKILVVEDSEEIRGNIMDLLEAEDFEVVGAENGSVGVQIAQRQKFDLIICDIMMPEMDGYDVISQLRQNPDTVDTPFIFLTAKAERDDLRQGMNLGADDYLTKPFTSKELMAAVEARLKRVAHQREKLERVTEQLEQLENFDSLTGLPNQSGLEGEEGYLERAISATDARNRFVPFLLLGLDRFSRINDVFGYASGDEVLQKLAQRLQDFLKTVQFASGLELGGVVRLSGDEFALVLPPTSKEDTAQESGQHLLGIISQPFSIQGKSIPVTGSIGIAFYPVASTLEELRRQAGVAMGDAKRKGGDRAQIYTRPLVGSDSAKDLQLAADLHRAWERRILQVFYQPRIDIRNRKITGVGAVIHWENPRIGSVSHPKILSLAEEAGLGVAVGEWLLETACRQAKTWQDIGIFLRVAVGISETIFNDANLDEIVASALVNAKLEPRYLELEIPASTIAKAKNLNAIASKMMILKRIGAINTISQFGIADSALNYLSQLKLDNLKIDASLTVAAAQNAPIISALVQVARNLKLRTIADGVATEDAAGVLRKQKCDEIQQNNALSPPEINRLFGKR
ncbi:MAG TPA: EAL domain-containing protein [Oscillatoriaceae cyanobacterium M33_DOE_052]|uniref:GGDEF domain-containing response regulator n=1 Tax=Planktothricoides sp. SpSt-374 TaxID=2282167 RepID=A0A7C3VQ47_9CYAN|nr:EAL domain-containing protein [Oscillatoriaceae cyanobacterium M33_DOE_052]